MKYTHIVGIDPSINHTGWAILDIQEKKPKIVRSGVVRFNSSMGDARYGWLTRELYSQMNKTPDPFFMEGNEILAAVERPSYHDSEAGILLARKKHLPTLFGAATCCISVCAFFDCDICFPTAGQWKRGVSKEKIKAQVETMYPDMFGQWQREDEWEAIGVAVWALIRMGQGVYEIYPAVKPQRKRKGGGDSDDGREGG